MTPETAADTPGACTLRDALIVALLCRSLADNPATTTPGAMIAPG
jgi:hypothetical protein